MLCNTKITSQRSLNQSHLVGECGKLHKGWLACPKEGRNDAAATPREGRTPNRPERAKESLASFSRERYCFGW